MNLSIDLNTICSITINMAFKEDSLYKNILNFISKSDEPLETKEIVLKLKSTRIKILYRLYNLRGDSRIRGKQVGSGKGAWIWWKHD